MRWVNERLHATVDLDCRTHGVALALAFPSRSKAEIAYATLTTEHYGCDGDQRIAWDVRGEVPSSRTLVTT